MTEVLELIAYMLQELLGLTFRILDSLEGTDLIFGALIVVTIYRFLLKPLLGGRQPNEITLGNSERVQAVTGLENAKKSKKGKDE